MENLLFIKALLTGDFMLFYNKVFIILATSTLVLVATLIDHVVALFHARKLGIPIRSSGLRQTIRKNTEYFALGIFMVMLDMLASMWLNLPYFYMFWGICCIVIEGKSVVEKFKMDRTQVSEVAKLMSDALKNPTTQNVLITALKEIISNTDKVEKIVGTKEDEK